MREISILKSLSDEPYFVEILDVIKDDSHKDIIKPVLRLWHAAWQAHGSQAAMSNMPAMQGSYPNEYMSMMQAGMCASRTSSVNHSTKAY